MALEILFQLQIFLLKPMSLIHASRRVGQVKEMVFNKIRCIDIGFIQKIWKKKNMYLRNCFTYIAVYLIFVLPIHYRQPSFIKV